jgi:hypothetical protein
VGSIEEKIDHERRSKLHDCLAMSVAADAVAEWLDVRRKRAGDWLFPSRSSPGEHINPRQCARLAPDCLKARERHSDRQSRYPAA